MGCKVSTVDVEVVSGATHELVKKPTGTLVFAAKKEGARDNIRRSSNAHTPGVPQDFFGLNIKMADVVKGAEIGRGSFGAVYKGEYKGFQVAVKQLFIPSNPKEKSELLNDFTRECEILGLLKHPNIVHFLGAVNEDPNFAFLTELYPGSVGNILSSAKKKDIAVTWNLLLVIAKDAATACHYLHTLEPQILHRDLKAENLLTDEKFRCRLSDFGLSRTVDKSKKDAQMTFCGSPSWVAPEIFRGDKYTEKVDVYSYGIVLWELFNFEKPYRNVSPMELPYLVGKGGMRPPTVKHIPEHLQHIMEGCWGEDSESRPGFDKIILALDSCKEMWDTNEPIDKSKRPKVNEGAKATYTIVPAPAKKQMEVLGEEDEAVES